MRYASIREMDISNGEGIGVALFTQGCSRHCKGCFSPQTWSFEGGKYFQWGIHDRQIMSLLKNPYITRFSVLGGEPLERDNLPYLFQLLQGIKYFYPEKKIWLWTGYTFEELKELNFENEEEKGFFEGVLSYCDYLVVGPFIQEQKDLTLQWRGSRNQEVVDMNKTRECGEKVLYIK